MRMWNESILIDSSIAHHFRIHLMDEKTQELRGRYDSQQRLVHLILAQINTSLV